MQPDEAGAEPGAEATADEYPRPDPPLLINLFPSMYIPGVLHIIHKFTEGLSAVLEFWDTFLMFLTHICRMLHQVASGAVHRNMFE